MLCAFGAGDGEACGSHLPLGGVVVGSLSMSGFQMKTLARRFGLGGGGALRRYPLGGIVGELRYHLVAAHWRFQACCVPGV